MVAVLVTGQSRLPRNTLTARFVAAKFDFVDHYRTKKP